MCKEPLHLAFSEKREREEADVAEENVRGGAKAARGGMEEEGKEELEEE